MGLGPRRTAAGTKPPAPLPPVFLFLPFAPTPPSPSPYRPPRNSGRYPAALPDPARPPSRRRSESFKRRLASSTSISSSSPPSPTLIAIHAAGSQPLLTSRSCRPRPNRPTPPPTGFRQLTHRPWPSTTPRSSPPRSTES